MVIISGVPIFRIFTVNKGARVMTMCFSKISHCDLELGLRTLKLELVQDIVILNICVK